MGSLNEAESFLSHTFTHIVVGGGTAGLVIAARLSENPALTVGIIEAGPVALDEPTINVPGRLGETLFTKYDWQFETTPQPGFNGRKLPWNRGKVLGGSSALNFMMWTRGSREDYDAWEELGNKGWGWEGILLVKISLYCVLFWKTFSRGDLSS
jgi:choline dehydrogenase-like flavoprotein